MRHTCPKGGVVILNFLKDVLVSLVSGLVVATYSTMLSYWLKTSKSKRKKYRRKKYRHK